MSHQRFSRIFVSDLNAAPCVTTRKEKVRERYPDLNDAEIVIVRREIESWYLAGLSADAAAELKVKRPTSTDGLTKEDLNQLRPKRLDSQLDFLLELLKRFDIEEATRRNKSFEYFRRKFL